MALAINGVKHVEGDLVNEEVQKEHIVLDGEEKLAASKIGKAEHDFQAVQHGDSAVTKRGNVKDVKSGGIREVATAVAVYNCPIAS